MKSSKKFNDVFKDIKPVIGMIHLAGNNPAERALEELSVYEKENLDGAIIENYHGTPDDVEAVLKSLEESGTSLVIGVNILPNEFDHALYLADNYGAKFIQLDYVAGLYRGGEFNAEYYDELRADCPDIIVLGGVWPKYYKPLPGSNLEADLRCGMKRAEAIVVTGEGTGKETPLGKIKNFREILGDYPLIVGAGLNSRNAYEQLCIADGAIVGSSLKAGNKTENIVDAQKVRNFMESVNKVREHYWESHA